MLPAPPSSPVAPLLAHVDSLVSRHADDSSLSFGLAAHSVRAASAAEVLALAEGAAARNMVLHMHLEEHPKEIEQCRAATGGHTPLQVIEPAPKAPPVELLLDYRRQ